MSSEETGDTVTAIAPPQVAPTGVSSNPIDLTTSSPPKAGPSKTPHQVAGHLDLGKGAALAPKVVPSPGRRRGHPIVLSDDELDVPGPGPVGDKPEPPSDSEEDSPPQRPTRLRRQADRVIESPDSSPSSSPHWAGPSTTRSPSPSPSSVSSPSPSPVKGSQNKGKKKKSKKSELYFQSLWILILMLILHISV
jgi:hypothetical protein